ncbi:cytochrome c oxidase subunit 3 family protein [Pontibacterium granulatum]|uniref:cytochrome c oxidase subunit 3 family protein n=1 Tax=Pontibacterium granulatum TaxID=2036029 RepID=UPI00249BE69C|nr:cytochrome c oxidase subunit 3 family protein [Pontibacterium granulatum]MDI3325887.1 cytochrome c oxidase subunit 3 family protein [Pontibacterium granulatum]
METALTAPVTADTNPHKTPLPGDLAMWMFIAAELSVFALLFLLFTVLRVSNADLFAAGQQTLHPEAGLINTLALLTASWFVVQAVIHNRRDNSKTAALWMFAAILSASVYVAVKCWEYWQLGSAGYDLDSNAFFTGYFLITGFHLLHVLLGMVILLFLAVKLLQGGYPAGQRGGLESGACYWHMVDLVWVLLFPLIYVIR